MSKGVIKLNKATIDTKWRVKMERKKRMQKLALHLLLVVGSILFMFPLIWLISTSLKTPEQIYKFPPDILPNPVRWLNYVQMFEQFKFFLYLKNTLTVVILVLAGVLLTAPLVAYSFSRLKWPGRNFLFYVLLGTMMIPADITRIPMYIFFSHIHWIDTYRPLWVPAWFGGGAFFIFLIRQFLMTIPKDMEDSALVDGAGYFTIYRKIMLPLIKPVLTTVAIFVFMGTWNDFMGPLIYINTTGKFTLSLALRLFQQNVNKDIQYGLLMAATTVMTLPIIMFFFMGQKQFIEGVVLTGIKG
ncbi:carbohydrate ABC transporter permease [Vallitalea okinawensis]|uniref:carbohydrate ABC transporter permease n=1 Tax=Vallitalea okinawensis TaxID=2078660 RepID=UPI000CFCFA8B|nr:carbohydrate ABC transporter permease [Vallitalea okinawensis]